ncbi:MAG: GTP cyclohydrolase II [Bacteroidetes bacterium]|jgi:3,4-dihydroxy 2-butanone 4-phosphate synthase/GTP cyclohydrolase II|nr:GTP cyclohydrolase II [Bacteroidota bacterium]
MNNNIEKGECVELPTKYGHFRLVPFLEKQTGLEHIALLTREFEKDDIVLTRIHSACATGDLFGSLRCDCGEQLEKAMKIIEHNGTGLILYLQQEGRGIGLMSKIKAYKLQEQGLDTVEANIHLGFAPDERNYKIASVILQLLGVDKVNLLTNNPDKISGLEINNIQVIKHTPLVIKPNKYNEKYMNTKQQKMNHLYNLLEV